VVIKNWLIKGLSMTSYNRDILVLLKSQFISQQALEQEAELLHLLFSSVESPISFCRAHELVDRNYITHKEIKILKAIGKHALKPFRFLINKN
jgi:hypothetical protein